MFVVVVVVDSKNGERGMYGDIVVSIVLYIFFGVCAK